MHDWNAIAAEYSSLVWRVAYRVLENQSDALDCRQDVFLDAIERVADAEVTNWPGFLNWLTVRRALDTLRKRSREPKQQIPDSELFINHSTCSIDWDELLELIRIELANLPEQQATVFWLHCVEEVNLREIAAISTIPESTTRVLLYRAKARLRELIAIKYPDLIPL